MKDDSGEKKHKNENTKTSLLEALANKSKCTFISDLHLICYSKAVLAAIPEDVEYSLREWCDAIYYITGYRKTFTTQKEAIFFLREYLQHKTR